MVASNKSQNFFDSDGIKLHFLHWSGAERHLVLLAGLGDNAQMFTSLGLKLAGRLNIYALTRRGHGQSEKPESGYKMENFVQDIVNLLDCMDIERAIIMGHSFGGIEAAFLARLFPQRVDAIIYLDALFPALEPTPDLSGDPVWSVVSQSAPTENDLDSQQNYLDYYKRRRPDWARIWCPSIEADLMDRVSMLDDGRLNFRHDDTLMNSILESNFPLYPEYDQIAPPQLAIVPGGDFHPGVPLDASNELQDAANKFWQKIIRPWIRQRTLTFHQAAPSAEIVEFDTPYHHLYLAKEDQTIKTFWNFLASI